ncbi:MAG: hypothetical protein H5T86_00800 [Armatimonadetes bacterium]|nr:hypothetical protein [Armatimonadota bacterium]
MSRAQAPDKRSVEASQVISPSAVAVLAGIVFSAFLSVATAYTDGFLVGSELGGCHFPLGPVLVLFFILMPVNWLLRAARLGGMRPGDILTAFCMMLLTAGIPTFGLALYLFPVMTGTFYMATPENKWQEVFFDYIPRWMAPPIDGRAIRWFYDGLPPGARIPWGEWLVPVAAWTVLVAAFYLAMFALASLLRRQWVERENLIFPLVELPLEMTLPARKVADSPAFFRSRLLWIGFGLPFLVHNIEALHAYIPAIPEIRLHGIPILQGLVERPWRYFRSPLYIHFSVIGIAYFLTTEISLSLWFFWWFGRLQYVVADALGRQPFLSRVEENQYQGALMAIVGYGLWVARGRMREAWQSLVSRSGDGEAMADGMALLSLGAAGAVVVGWLMAAGVSPLTGGLTYVLFLVICWGMARLVVESGIMFAKVTQMRPTRVIRGLLGCACVSRRELTVLAMVEYVFMYDLKSMMMPQLLHSLKVADEARISRHSLYRALAVAVAVSVAVSYWASLYIAYSKGARAMHPWFFIHGPRGNAEELKSMLVRPVGPELGRIASVAAGAAFTAALSMLRQRFLWFPLHPIGYVVGQGFEASRMWFPFLIGWMCKATVMKYGSVRVYRAFRPLFLGLVLGEYSAAGLWLIIDAVAGRTGHRIFP